jgi:hypothetical protein
MLALPNGFRPEGLTTFGGTLYVCSQADGGILAVDQRSGRTHPLLPGLAPRAHRRGSALASWASITRCSPLVMARC